MRKKILQSIRVLLSGKFFQGSIIVTVSSLLVSVINYFFNLIIARGVSVSAYGEYFSVMSYVVLLTIPITGFGSILIKKLGNTDPQHRVELLHQVELWSGETALKSLPIVVFTVLATATSLYFFGNLQPTSIAFIVGAVILTFLQIFYISTLQAYQAFFVYACVIVGSALVRLLSGFFVMSIKGNVSELLGMLFLSTVISVIVGAFLTRKTERHAALPRHTAHEFPSLKKILFSSRFVTPMLTTLGVIGLAQLDVVIVKALMPSTQSGLYSAFSLLSKIIFFLTGPLATVGYVFFTGKEHREQAKHLLLLITLGTACIGAAATLFYYLFPHFTIAFFLDQRFFEFAHILWLGGVFGTVYSLVVLFSQYFVAQNSWIGTLSLLAAGAQAVGILFVHSSLQDVMVVNIFVCSGLLLAYLSFFTLQLVSQPVKSTQHGNIIKIFSQFNRSNLPSRKINPSKYSTIKENT